MVGELSILFALFNKCQTSIISATGFVVALKKQPPEYVKSLYPICFITLLAVFLSI